MRCRYGRGMSRAGKIITLGIALMLLVGATWYLVSLIRAAVTPTVTPAAEPECVIREFGPTNQPMPTIALADSTMLTAAGGEVPANAESLALNAVQLQHASTINAVGLRRGLSDRARVIAVATALQESSLRNLPNGDLDSVGLFQQRPSQGWGTAGQIRDPIFAAGAFYDALSQVANWDSLPLTEAAQAVQYSAYPEAYGKWEPAAVQLVAALSEVTYGTVNCRAGAVPPTADAPTRNPLVGAEAAAAPLRELLAAAAAELGGLSLVTLSADGLTATVGISLAGLAAEQGAAALSGWTVAHATSGSVSAVDVAGYRWADHAWGPATSPLSVGQVTVAVG